MTKLNIKQGFLTGSLPVVRFSADRKANSFTLVEPVTYLTKRIGGGSRLYTIKVPAGFKTDLASIPRLLPLALHRNPVAAAAIVHDWLYSTKDMLNDLPRKKADLIFRDAMRDNGVGRLTAATYYRFVRVFGWRYYNADA